MRSGDRLTPHHFVCYSFRHCCHASALTSNLTTSARQPNAVSLTRSTRTTASETSPFRGPPSTLKLRLHLMAHPTTMRVPSLSLLRAFLRPCNAPCSQVRHGTNWMPREKYAKVTGLDKLHRRQRVAERQEREIHQRFHSSQLMMTRTRLQSSRSVDGATGRPNGHHDI